MPLKDPEKRRAYHREYMREWYGKHREEHTARTTNVNRRVRATTRKLIDELKSRPCPDGGGTFPPVLMDFDHARGTKRGIISRLSGGRMAMTKLMDEIAKCEVVCANSHPRRTLLRRLGLEVKPSEGLRFLGPNFVSVLIDG